MAPKADKDRTDKTRLRLKPADSFDLIRLLARSQHDPRKAVCELLQNSLDARAAHVSVTWFTDRGARALRIEDDGEGIFPELARPDALRRIATTIGHSHKRSLTPAQRRELMALGKYGIGLLGFWAVGAQMQIRSRVGGGETWLLSLVEDSPEARVERVRTGRLDEPDTHTQVTIRGVHEQVVRQLRPPRLQAYLASELRGQLLGRDVQIRIHDRVARGRAVKEFAVVAERFLGRPLDEFRSLEVPGYDEARVELYLVSPDDERRGRVALACGGTTVLDDIAAIDGTGEPRAPWGSGQFEGVVDFPQLDVAPGTRRDFRRDAAAEAFLAALASLEEKLRRLLVLEEERQREEQDRNLSKRIKQVFRRIPRLLPEYDLFDVRAAAPPAGAAAVPGAGEGAKVPAIETGDDDLDEPADDAGFLFAPGPLAAVVISPAKSRIPPRATRTLTARARDEGGRPAAGEIAFAWRVDGPGELAEHASRAVYTAPAGEANARVHVVATQGDAHCEASAEIAVTDATNTARSDLGIPEPQPVQGAGEPWRSRLRDGRWEYNTGHRDYLAASQGEKQRLSYLVHLFAKEVVLRNFGSPGDAAVLERMVEILTYLQDVPVARQSAPRDEREVEEGADG